MSEKRFVLRGVGEDDYDFVLELNQANVEVLAPMDMEKLRYFLRESELFQVIEVDGERAAFLIAFREGKDYSSENYRWFSAKYPSFLYIDRIVIGEKHRAMGLGRFIYDEAKAYARKQGLPVLLAEIDTEPVYNDTSLRFHKAMGFEEVGTQWVKNGEIKVSLQAAKL